VASNTASLVLYVLGIISASKYGTSITAFVIVALSVPLFWVGAFIAWNKQYDGKVEAEKRRSVGRPSIAPSSYKQKDHSFGMTIINSGYAAYDVHIPENAVTAVGIAVAR
jgi:heme O synthase-like polyprenyltransferase